MHSEEKIYVAGHKGLVGSAITRELAASGFNNLIVRDPRELDLRDQRAVSEFFSATKPHYVFLAAAKVGGIMANNDFPADFIADNLKIQTNVISSSFDAGVRKLMFLGSSCIYPKMAPQPIAESALLSGPLEPTNEWYAVAKIAGLKMCQAYRRQHGFNAISIMPTNLYGPNDNFDLQTSHVLPALIRRFHEAKRDHSPEVVLWGTGTPRREFLHVSDLASAAVFLMQTYDGEEIVNVGTGEDLSIAELAEIVRSTVGFQGEVRFDPTKPDGTPRKLLDVSKLRALGWQPRISLVEGIRQTYEWFVDSIKRSATAAG